MRDRSPDGKSTYLDQPSFDSARTRLSSIAFLHFFDSEVDINTIFPRCGDKRDSFVREYLKNFVFSLAAILLLDEQEIP